MPKMVRVYIRSVLIGVALSCCFVAALLALDVAHLRHLVLSSPLGWLAVTMMVVFNTIVFAGVQFAIAIMAEAETPPSSGRKVRIARSLKPALALATASKSRRK